MPTSSVIPETAVTWGKRAGILLDAKPPVAPYRVMRCRRRLALCRLSERLSSRCADARSGRTRSVSSGARSSLASASQSRSAGSRPIRGWTSSETLVSSTRHTSAPCGTERQRDPVAGERGGWARCAYVVRPASIIDRMADNENKGAPPPGSPQPPSVAQAAAPLGRDLRPRWRGVATGRCGHAQTRDPVRLTF